METKTVNQPDLSSEAPSWVAKALAWMREDYERSTKKWVERLEAPQVRAQLGAGC